MPAGEEPRRPRLAPHVRLTYDRARDRHILLTPETVTVLNGTGASILGLFHGQRTVAEIVAELRGRYDRVGFTPELGVPSGVLDDIASSVSGS